MQLFSSLSNPSHVPRICSPPLGCNPNFELTAQPWNPAHSDSCFYFYAVTGNELPCSGFLSEYFGNRGGLRGWGYS